MPKTLFHVLNMPNTKEFQRRSGSHIYHWAIVRYLNGKPVEAVAWRRDIASATDEMASLTRNSHYYKYEVHVAEIIEPKRKKVA